MKRRILFLIAAAVFLLFSNSLQAAISSVTLTPASPTTLSNGNSYYLAGVQYSFRVQAVDTAATGIADWTSIQLIFPSGESITYDINAGSATTSGVVFDAPATNNTSVYTNIDFTIRIRFRWDSADYVSASRSITATVVNVNGATAFDDAASTFSFGKCSTIRVVNFAQDGVAADGYINPWHSGFNVTGAIVYNVTGATIADRVETRDAGEITNTTLYRYLASSPPPAAGTDTGLNDNDMNDNECTYNVPAGTGILALTNYSWYISVEMDTVTATELSQNYLSFNCDQIRIDSIAFINGGGFTSAPTYYRSVNMPGTQVHITASRESGAVGVLSMIGNAVFKVRNITNPTQEFTLTITSGDNGTTSGIGNVPFPSTLPVNGSTESREYQVVSVTGSAFNDEQDIDINAGSITQTPANPVILWDRNDPPGNNGLPGAGETPFTTAASFTVNPVNATSFTLNWQPVTALADPPYDVDFYTYRIYYRETLVGGSWTIIDRSINGYRQGDTYDLSNPARTTVPITGLTPFTQYDYFMTAVDVFGQEVEYTAGTSDALYAGAPAGNFGQVTTSPTEISASITDGKTEYAFSQFETTPAVINAANRPVNKTSIRVRTYIVSTGDQPDSVNIILAQDNGSGSTGSDLYVGGAIPLSTTITYERIACSKSAPNTWQAYIPSGNQFLVEGQFCRFIIESIRGGTPTYSDTDSITDGNPNNYEYTFMVQTNTNFQPWPTRVLNNVITDKHPIAYPSYYLSADAYVTITVHDIKGRPVATLIDSGFRKGGQNIKEGGWTGDNKSRRKLGVGLYYIRFEAKRASDGKIILNETEKVVIAK